MPNTFDVDIYTVEDGYGVECIVPSERDEQDSLAEIQQTIAESYLAPSPDSGDAIKRRAAALKAELEGRMGEHARLRADAKRTTYKLTIPNSKQYWDAEMAARTVDENSGASSVDASKLMRYLLSRSVEGMDVKAVEELPPAITQQLWARLTSAIFPSPGRLLARRAVTPPAAE